MQTFSFRLWQKSLSSVLVAILLFIAIFEAPLSLPTTQASDFFRRVDIVSFLVDKETYATAGSEIRAYADNIQTQLPDTRVVIFPLDRGVHPQFIAALQEKLYFQGETSTREENTTEQLIGTVLIGKIPLPVVYKNDASYLSLAPYVDFRDKAFVYSAQKDRFEASSSNESGFIPEIWHGVISPNTGDDAKDRSQIRAYLDRVSRAYAKTQEFQEKPDQKPYVFWFDAPKESKAISPKDWMLHNTLYLENIEDITYNRFTKYFAKYISSTADLITNSVIDGTSPNIPKSFADWSGSLSGGSQDLTNVPDATVRDIIVKTAKKYGEAVNEKFLGDIGNYVFGAGRYSSGTTANLDTPSALITKKDAVTFATLKDANTRIEDVIDSYVRTNLAQDIPVLSEVKEKIGIYAPIWKEVGGYSPVFGGLRSVTENAQGTNTEIEFTYRNYFFGSEARSLQNASQCSIVRGSYLTGSSAPYLVESNAAYNGMMAANHIFDMMGNVDGNHPNSGEILNNSGASSVLCVNADGLTETSADAEQSRFKTTARWGGNSPLNARSGTVPLELFSQRYDSFYQSIYDPAGSRQIAAGSPLTINTPKDCSVNHLLLQPYEYAITFYNNASVQKRRGWPRDATSLTSQIREVDDCSDTFFRKPIDIQKTGKQFSCATDFDATTENDALYDATFKASSRGYVCGRDEDYPAGSQKLKLFDLGAKTGFSETLENLLQKGTCTAITPSGSDIICTPPANNNPTNFGLTDQLSDLPTFPLSFDLTPYRSVSYTVPTTQCHDDDGCGGVSALPSGLASQFPKATNPGAGNRERLIKKRGLSEIRFHRVSSLVFHKSPTNEEYGKIVKNLATPSMPVDRDRSVEFLSTLNQTEKIIYPNLFRIVLENVIDFTPEKVDELLRAQLDRASTIINSIRKNNDPTLVASSYLKELRRVSGGSMESAPQINLYEQLRKNEELYNLLVESILWKNLRNAPAKYGYVLENWLDRTGRTNISLATNPGHRPQGYEISYLVGNGSADRMFLEVDPDQGKLSARTQNTIQKNTALRNARRALEIQGGSISPKMIPNLKTSDSLSCGPIEGVELSRWLPAIQCWIKENLPPRIRWVRREGDPEPLPNTLDLTTDTNKDGIADDYLAQIASRRTSFVLLSDREAYEPSGTIRLDIGYQQNQEWLTWDQKTVIDLAVTKIQTPEKTFVPTGISAQDWQKIVESYLNFRPVHTRISDGKSTLFVTARGKIASVTFEAKTELRDKNNQVLLRRSAQNTIELENTTLIVSLKTDDPLDGNGDLVSSSSYTAGNARGVQLSFSSSSTKGIAYPLSYQIRETLSGNVVQTGSISPLSDAIWNFQWNTKNEKILSTAQDYDFLFQDKRGVSATVTLSVLPDVPQKLALDTNSTIFVQNADFGGMVKLLDRFGNLVTGHTWPLNLSVTGPATISQEGDKKETTLLDPYMIEGYIPFVIHVKGAGAVHLSAKINTSTSQSLTQILDRTSLASVRGIFTFDGGKTPTVGGASYPFTLRIVDAGGKILPLSSRAFVRIPDVYGTLNAPTLDIQNGEAHGVLTTKTVATPSTQMVFDIPGVTDISGTQFAILPQDPVAVDISSTKTKLIANSQDVARVQAYLVDRYGNTVFNHASGATVTFSIENGSALGFASKNTTEQKTFVQGVSQPVLVQSTDFAGMPYVIVKTNLPLEQTSYTYGTGADAVVLSGVSENAILISSSYVFDSDRAERMQYNTLITALLGGAYGNVAERGYLGGSLLFTEGSKAISVVSLLSAPQSRNAIVRIDPTGEIAINSTLGERNTVATYEVIGGVPQVRLTNEIDGTETARILFQMQVPQDRMITCSESPNQSQPYASCSPADTSTPFIALAALQGSAYSVVKQSGNLEVRDITGNTIGSVTPQGAITGLNVVVHLDQNSTWPGTVFVMERSGQEIARVLMSQGTTGVLSSLKTGEAPKPGISLELLDMGLSVSRQYAGTSTAGSPSLSLVSADAFAGAGSDFSDKQTIPGLEQTDAEPAVGWTGENKTFLEIASGVSVGRAVQKYQNWSTIVLGDPVYHLTVSGKKRPDGTSASFDHSLGESVAIPDGNLVGFDLADVNGDGSKDIYGYLDDGSVQLWGNYSQIFKPITTLIRAKDIANGSRVAGDFFGDGYADVVGVNKKGDLVLFENTKGQFTRTPVHIEGDAISGKIVQLQHYDMDGDGKEDLVIVDDSGTLSVLYGKEGNRFVRLVIDKSLGAQIRPEFLKGTTANAAVSYQGGSQPIARPQIQELSPADLAAIGAQCDALIAQQGGAGSSQSGRRAGGLRFLSKNNNLPSSSTSKTYGSKAECVADLSAQKQTGGQQMNTINTFLFYKTFLPTPTVIPASPSTLPQNTADILNTAAGTDTQGNPSQQGADLAQGFSDIQAIAPTGSIDYTGLYQASAAPTPLWMLRASFVDPATLKIQKSYSGSLQQGSVMAATLTLENTGTQPITQITLVDKDNTPLPLNETGEYTVSYRDTIGVFPVVEDPAGSFSYFYDLRKYPLNPKEKLTITYFLKMPRVSIGTIQVGQFKQTGDGTDGPNGFGDIFYSPSKDCTGKRLLWWSRTTQFGGPRKFAIGERTFQDNSLQNSSNPVLQKNRCDIKDSLNQANTFSSGSFENGTATSTPATSSELNPFRDETWPGKIKYIKPFKGDFIPDILQGRTKSLRSRNTALANDANTGSASTATGALACTGSDATSLSQKTLESFNADSQGGGIPDRANDSVSVFETHDSETDISLDAALGIDLQRMEDATSKIEATFEGKCGGFGGGGCITTPINYAPLAPGASPVIFGIPINPGALTPYTSGLPIFAAPTACLFPVWPICPIGAGGWIGGPIDSSVFRLYVTPTLTGAMGITMCFGVGSTSLATTPPGLSPIIPGGNCINIAMPIPGLCSGDGSDGDPSNLGPATRNGAASGGVSGVQTNAFVNSESCQAGDGNTLNTTKDFAELQNLAYRYLSSGGRDSLATSAFLYRVQKNPQLASHQNTAMLSIGGLGYGDDDGGLSLDVGISSDLSNIVQVKNSRIPAFPDFIMDWATAQIEEIVNKLFTLPRLIITLPDLSGFGEYGKFADGFNSAYTAGKERAKNDQAQERAARERREAKNNKVKSIAQQYRQNAVRGYESALKELRNFQEQHDLLPPASLGQQIGGMRAGLEYINSLPLFDIDWQTIRFALPWFGPEDLNTWILKNERIAEADVREIDRFITDVHEVVKGDEEKWASLIRFTLDLDKTRRSIESNMKTIREYKEFPKKLNKYIRWKEKYLNDIVNNYIDPLSRLLAGWMADNGRRFKSWVELIVLLKAIAKSWQTLIDIFADVSASCKKCQVERYDMKYWLIKITALLPKLPIILFPKWPDVELDLHDIALGIKIAMPEFSFDLVPIKLPTIMPRLLLPEVPSFGVDINITLPAIPQLPKLPELPDLPELPLLPLPVLPDLPPPPLLPKMFASFTAYLEIIAKILRMICILRTNIFAPEWDSGIIIAMLTDRTMPLPIDKLFLDLGFPSNPTMKYLDRIRLSTHVNAQFETDFIVQMIQQIVDPITHVGDGLANIMRDYRPTDIDLRNLFPPMKEGIQMNVDVTEQGKVNTESSLDAKKIQGYIPAEQTTKLLRATLNHVLDGWTGLGEKYQDARKNIMASVDTQLREQHDFVQNLAKNTQEKITQAKESFAQQMRDAQKQGLLVQNLYSGDEQLAMNALAQLRLSQDAHLTNAFARTSPAAQQMQTAKQRLLASAKTLALATNSDEDIAPVVSAPAPGNTYDDILSGQRFAYKGIYIIDQGRHERLFDYTEEVDKNTKVIPLDFDHDGDEDVFFLLGNKIWLKKNLSHTPKERILHRTDVFDENHARKEILGISKTAPLSDIRLNPDHLNATSDQPTKLALSFTPNNSERDSHFRFQAFRNTTFPTTPLEEESREKWILEMFTGLDEKPLDPERTDTGATGYTHIATFHEDSAGDATITQQKVMRVLLPDNRYREGLTGPEKTFTTLTIRAGQSLYTGLYEARIRSTDEKGATFEKLLAPRSRYVFANDRNLEVLKGEIYLFAGENETRTIDVARETGMPILDSAEIHVGKKSHLTLSFNDGTHLRIGENTHFYLVDLGQRAESYATNVVVPNGLYYGTVRTVDRTEGIEGYSSMMAWQTLFAPERESDTEPPVMQMPKTIRIPVNIARTVNFGKYALNEKDVAQLQVVAQGVSEKLIHPLDPSHPLLWQFGPFENVGRKNLLVTAQDANGNTAEWNVTLIISVPDSQVSEAVSSADTFAFSGRISTNEPDIPLQIYRFRDGFLEKALSGALFTDKNGLFGMTGSARDEAVLQGASGPIARFDGKTGAPLWTASGYAYQFVPTSAKDGAHLAIVSSAGEVVYRQYWALLHPATLALVGNETLIPAEGNGWWYVPAIAADDPAALHLERATLSDPNIPQGAYLVREDGEPVFGLSSGGQIYTLSPRAYSIRLQKDAQGWPALAVQKDGILIGRIHLRTTAPYVNEGAPVLQNE